MKIESYNEWSALKSVVVGTASYANFPVNNLLYMTAMMNGGWTKTRPPEGPVPKSIIEQTNAELDILAATLESHGVEVHRPMDIDYQKLNGQYGYCPRDNLLVVGNRVIEAPMTLKVRQHELNGFREIKREAIQDGARWFRAPEARIQIKENIDAKGFKLNNVEPVFDAANIMRFGNKILYLVSDSGNQLGAQWLQAMLTDMYEVVTTDVYNSSHIDSTICPIDLGHVVLNANRVNDNNLPDFLQDWNKIYITEDMIDPQPFLDYPYASKWIAINMLAIGNKKVICDATQPRIHDELAKHGFEPIPLHLTHARTLGGGFHCVTLDLHRSIE